MMKVPVTLLIPLLFSIASFSQGQKNSGSSFENVNIGIGVGMGEEIAFNLFATASLNNDFYGGFHYLATSVHSNNAPSDYISGTHLFSNSTRIPRNHFISRSLMIGKLFQKKQTAFSFSFETGISWIRYSEALFSRKRNAPGFFGPSSDFDGYQTFNKTGLLLNGKINYRIRSDISLELSTYLNINSLRSVITENLTVAFKVFGKKAQKSKAKSK